MITRLILNRPILYSGLVILLGACDRAGPLDPEVQLDVMGPQASQVQAVPFHGNTVGMLVAQTVPAPTGRCPVTHPIFNEYRGSGNATHLGRFTVTGGECIFFNPADPSTASAVDGRYRFEAANGDWIDLAFDQASIQVEAPPSPWVLWSTSPQVVEGSGRFQGAEFVGVVWGGGYNAMTNETYSSIDGQIIYDASLRGSKGSS
jgi:hypothetical protein